MSGNWIRKETRLATVARARVSTPSGVVFRCAYCGGRLPLHLVQLDHVVPRAAGGSNKSSNLVVACGPCNDSKGRKTDLAAWIRRRFAGVAFRGVDDSAPASATPEEIDAMVKELLDYIVEATLRRVETERTAPIDRAAGKYWARAYVLAKRAP